VSAVRFRPQPPLGSPLAVHGSQFTVAFLPRSGRSGENPKTMSGTKKITMGIQWSDEGGVLSVVTFLLCKPLYRWRRVIDQNRR
jgi:hypothetical protein